MSLQAFWPSSATSHSENCWLYIHEEECCCRYFALVPLSIRRTSVGCTSKQECGCRLLELAPLPNNHFIFGCSCTNKKNVASIFLKWLSCLLVTGWLVTYFHKNAAADILSWFRYQVIAALCGSFVTTQLHICCLLIYVKMLLWSFCFSSASSRSHNFCLP